VSPSDLSDSLFLNPAWHALRTKHRHFAIGTGAATRYPADVAPVAALSEPSAGPLEDLRALLVPGEAVWLFGQGFPEVEGLAYGRTLDCLHMFIPADAPLAEPISAVEDLSSANGAEMVALTDIAFPGFFRPRTYEMGSYFGIRSTKGELIAMAGERLMLEGFPEISAVCTHPDYRGRGYAEGLVTHLIRRHRRQGLQSWLHVVTTNHVAHRLYERMGFQTVRQITLTSVSRSV
jgi:ribosomal protein S18 acetylase RimI-like enzyme